MPLRKYSFLFLLLVLLPACIIPGCMVRHSLTINVVAGEPFALDWLMRVAAHEKQSSKLIIWRQGQSRFARDGTPEPIDNNRSRLYTGYANRLETCCISAVYKIPEGSFVVNAPRGSAIITGTNTNVLRIFNADARTANQLFANIDLVIPQTAPAEQILEVIFYAFWNPLPATAQLENFDPRVLSRSQDAFVIPWVLGTRGRYRVVLEYPPGFFPAPEDAVPDVELPEMDMPEIELPEILAVEEEPPNQDPQPDPPELPPDSDKDGYIDDIDVCPNEGDQGLGLGADGCPIRPDTDLDGVPDQTDACPITGDLGYGVAPNGCPIMTDTDGDGVNDYMDYCVNDGDEGNGVDSTGCPIPGDSDGDGINDYNDYCASDGDQGNGVDALGCPIPGDSDGDGVNDYNDYCANDGDQGNGVDSNGCPIE